MPIDQATEAANVTSRRTFLTRTAIGGAVVTAGAIAGPAAVTSLLPAAWAHEEGELVTDAEFADFAAPLELGAVQAYLAAAQSEQLNDEALGWVRTFSTHHNAVAATLASLLPETAAAPVVDPDFTAQARAAVEAAGDQDGVLAVLAQVEETLAATHLAAIPTLRDATTARTVCQVLCVENQQAALLIVNGGGSVADATPAVASTEGALDHHDGESSDESDTTTTAAN